MIAAGYGSPVGFRVVDPVFGQGIPTTKPLRLAGVHLL
jgi:hypothetical protein